VNARGSSKCRRYDPVSGRKTHEIPSPGRPYEIVFARLISECQTLKGLPHAKVADLTKGLPVDYINELRSQVDLQPIVEGPTVARHIPSGGMGVQQKLMRHAQIATTMNVYGDAMMESKRAANSKVVQMALRPALKEAK
jgi:hypothetical protein